MDLWKLYFDQHHLREGVGIKCLETPKKLDIKFLKDAIGIGNQKNAMCGDGRGSV